MALSARCDGLLAGVLGVAISLVSASAGAVSPTGYLDNAGCDGIAGWAQDPDSPSAGIAVHLYLGGPAGSGAPAVGITADVYREDLCGAIGSCEHGFFLPVPLSFLDGQPRDIHAYGIDAQGEPNPELGNSPRPLQCAPAASGVRRPITNVGAVDAWKLSQFWDLLPLPAADAGALAEGSELPDAPELVTPDDGSGALWLVDRGVRRPVPAAVIGAWRFDPAAAAVKPAAEIQAMVEGPAVRGRPVLVMFQGLALVDDPIPEVIPPSTTSSSGAGGGGGSGGSGGAGDGGSGGGGGDPIGGPTAAACAIPGDPGGRQGGCSFVLGAALVVLVRAGRPWYRRRRRE